LVLVSELEEREEFSAATNLKVVADNLELVRRGNAGEGVCLGAVVDNEL
jgi:hypothetical protein